MFQELGLGLKSIFEENILNHISTDPFSIVLTIIDFLIVVFLFTKAFEMLKDTRAWQLLKGIAFLIIITFLSDLFKFKILNYILTSIMTYGMFMLIVVFQPELRRALEQLGTSKITRFLGIDKDIAAKTKEMIYKVVIAATELSKNKTGALIVIERDIKIKDIISTGLIMDSEISPQLLCNIFVQNTPLHDGAVIISDNKIAAASCMLPLSNDKDIARELGTRHRAAIGVSKESDAIVVVISEETGKISIAKDGTLIADLKEEVLKKILIKYLVSDKENVITDKAIKRFSKMRKSDKEKSKEAKK